jgi:predicted  nucleic acid-binding Zn-ribbon protein
MKGVPEINPVTWLEQKVQEQADKIEELEKKIEELEEELSSASNQIDDLGDDVANLSNTVNELEEKAINDKNKIESDHIKMLEKFMLDNGYILGNGKTMESLLWELGRQIFFSKKR